MYAPNPSEIPWWAIALGLALGLLVLFRVGQAFDSDHYRAEPRRRWYTHAIEPEWRIAARQAYENKRVSALMSLRLGLHMSRLDDKRKDTIRKLIDEYIRQLKTNINDEF